jgi:CHAT domain-containing protein
MDSVTFSYAASGALLSRIARRRPADVGASVLLVGDPTGDLPHAQAEVEALREAFYPDAVRWGEPAGLTDGAATPARLRDALARGGHSLVHYAGHATIDVAHPGSSALVLGGSQRLRADRISRLDPEQPYRVCLAACTTHLTAEAFDEVFTLSTAFLLGGAATVVGSLWRIKDVGTAALTFMLHHYLNRGVRPADALHRAQLWMLRPGRSIPPSMPATIRETIPDLDLTDPIRWAGLTHQGH